MLTSPWEIAFDQAMSFHKVLSEQWQILRLSASMDVDSHVCFIMAAL